MAGWVDAVSLLVKHLPDIRRLVSPEFRREQQERMASVSAAADDAKREAKASHDAVTTAMTQVLRNQAELQARVESCDQRVKDALTEMRERDALLRAQMLWLRAIAVAVVVAIVLLIVLLARR